MKAFELYSGGSASKTDALDRVSSLGLIDVGGKPLSPQAFDKLLGNPIYAGGIVSKWGIKVRGQFEPIVSQVFDRVQTLLAGKGSGVKNKVKESPEFPLRVFVRCGVCGTPLTGSFATGKRGGKYPYYYCREKTCRSVSVRRDELHVDFAVLLERFRPQTNLWPVLRTTLKSYGRRGESSRRRLPKLPAKGWNSLKTESKKSSTP